MKKRKDLMVMGLMFICFVSSTVQAAPRGTPTIVTNDSSNPVAVSVTNYPSNPVIVTGNVGTSYKPVGITTATISINENTYNKSLLCANQFPGSRICSSIDLIDNPGKISIQNGNYAIITPSLVAGGGNTFNVVDASGITSAPDGLYGMYFYQSYLQTVCTNQTGDQIFGYIGNYSILALSAQGIVKHIPPQSCNSYTTAQYPQLPVACCAP